MAETITFFSNYLEHVLTRRPHAERPIDGMVGAWQTVQTPIRYKFQPAVNEKGELVGRLDVVAGQDRLVDHAGWLAPDAEQGVERDAAEALRVHRAFGDDFWLMGHEPGTLYPRPQDTRAAIRKASVALDIETLEKLIADEQASHGRKDLISEAQDALALINEMVEAQHAAQQEAEQEAEPPKAAPKAKAKPKAPAAA